jgi:MFS family permease
LSRVEVRVGPILALLALLVLGYFSGDYMLAAVIKTMHEEGVIPGGEETWRLYAGLLKTVPGLVGLALTFLWGVLADRVGRPRLILLLGLTMGFSLALVSTAYSYYYLLAVLIVFGVGKIGISPVIYAFIPDILPPERRGAGYAAYYAPSVLGFVLGVLLGGVLLYWRTAYLLVGLLVLAATVPLYLLSRGVRIGMADGMSRAAYSLRGALRAAVNRTVLIVMLQIIPWTIPWGFITLYAVDYLTTRWGISVSTASMFLAVAALSIAFGHIVGGRLGDKLVSKGDVNGRVKVSILGIAVGYAAMAAMLAYPYPYGREGLSALLPPLLLATAGLLFSTFAYPNLSSVISDCVPAEYRGTVFSLYNILNTAGWALGPVIYGWLVKSFMASGAAESEALLKAALLVEGLWLLSLAAWVAMLKTYPRDRLAARQA